MTLNGAIVQLKEIEENEDFPFYLKGSLNKVIETLKMDCQEVRYGEWIKDGHHIRCSRCDMYMCDTDREGDVIPTNYCPHCGAKMNEVE